MAKIFLSYSRQDASKAQRLAEWLQLEGHEVWRDEDDIGGGASFSSEIDKALKDCDAVATLWSAASVQSAWVRDEAAYGRDAGKLLPLSLDGTAPPLGFREFQSIDLSKWRGKGQPPAAERIKKAIERIAGGARAAQTEVSVAPPRRIEWFGRTIAAAILLVAVIAVTGIMLWRYSPRDKGITIIVSASPASPDRATAADYANVAAADMAGFLPTRFAGARVVGPAEVGGDSRGYRVQIAADRHGQAADASLTLSDSDEQGILWSKSWNVPDMANFDLREQVSLAASKAALCLIDARGGANRIRQPALGLYIGACAGLADPNTSDAQLAGMLERVVKLAPDFPRAWAMLAVGRAILAEGQRQRTGKPDIAAVIKAQQAIVVARRLDPHNGLPYLAEWRLHSEDPLLGQHLLDKAVEIDPDEPILQARRSDALQAVGRMSDAIEAAHRATELDPLWSFPRARYIDALAYAGQFSRAKAEIADAHRKWPQNAEIDYADFSYQFRYGDPKLAEQLMPKVLDFGDAQLAPYRKLLDARVDRSPGKIDDAIESLREAEATDPRARNTELLALGLFGKVDDAYRLLGAPAFQPRLDVGILFRPEFRSLRADPRFIQVAARLGLVRYWRESGKWPDFCTSEQLRYDCKAEAAKYRT